MASPKIAIIGAGPSGLTLARLLQKNGIACTVYESDTDRSVRNQGGSLDLHPNTGQLALQEAGLIDEFWKYARPESDVEKLLTYDGTVLWDENVTGNCRPDESKPEIDRVQLRRILLDSIQPGSIHWSRKLVRVDAEDGGKYALQFADGIVETGFDLVVGADGAWSRVRPLVTDEKPFYSGITLIDMWAVDVDGLNPWLSKYVGNGSYFMFDEGRGVIGQRNGDGCIRVYACVRQPVTWVHDCGIDWSDHDAARKALVEGYFSDCGDDVKRVILDSRGGLIQRPLWMLPVGIKWESRPGVTVVGDAAHLMTIFAGLGVNVAMADGLELARALIARKDSFDHNNIAIAIKQYENSMFERGRQDAQQTSDNLQRLFSAGGIERMASALRKHYETKKAAEDSENLVQTDLEKAQIKA